MNKIAFAHPGKLGDALYCLPVMRKLCADHGTMCDFYTSNYCASLKRLFEYQSFIDTFYISDTYQLQSFDCGCQPAMVPVPENMYSSVYQLGYKAWPRGPLPYAIARSIGIHEQLPIQYDLPQSDRPCNNPYIVIAPRGHASFKDTFSALVHTISVEHADISSIIIGAQGDNILDYNERLIDFTGYDMLETLCILSHANGFVGLMSSQLALANGFTYPKIAIHDGVSYTMDHVITGPTNHYPIWPTTEQIISLLGMN